MKLATISGRLVAAPTLLLCGVCQGVRKVVHFFFGADVVCFAADYLLFIFGHSGIGVHNQIIYRQRHTDIWMAI